MRFLIIGGAPKSGTTSLYRYLGDHPGVVSSAIKETRYFLDDDYYEEKPSLYVFRGSLDDYKALFPATCENQLRMEATPSYLYSKKAPRMIREQLPMARLIFILRNPLERLLSEYRFNLQNGNFNKDVSFDAYVGRQMSRLEMSQGRGLLAVEKGLYSKFLPAFIECLGQENVLVVLFDDLRDSPQQLMRDICAFCHLDAGFYDNYRFKAYNPTMNARFPKLRNHVLMLQERLLSYIAKGGRLHDGLRGFRRLIDSLFWAVGRAGEEPVVCSEETLRLLHDYYRDEPARLQALLGWPAPPMWGGQCSNSSSTQPKTD